MSFSDFLNEVFGIRNTTSTKEMIIGGAIGCAVGAYLSYEKQQNYKTSWNEKNTNIDNSELLSNAIWYGTIGTLFGTAPKITAPLFALTVGTALLINGKSILNKKNQI
jgi:hypothetical protein